MAASSENEDNYGVPRGWLQCPKMGEIVEDLFLPFKTPLCGLYDNQMEARLRFHPEDVFNSALLDGKKMGLWCDFTKTDRFYFVHEVEKHGCIYKKIRMEEHEGSPVEEHVQEFVRVVQNFVREHPGEIVGVHCTHGFNRTGFAIASYLATVKNMDVDRAVQTFAKLRPCGIYKQEYINDLFSRYGLVEDCVEAPEPPKWDSDEGSPEIYAPDNAGSGKPFIPKMVKGVRKVLNQYVQNKIREQVMVVFANTRNAVRAQKLDSLRPLPAYEEQPAFNYGDFMRVHVIIMGCEVYLLDQENKVYFVSGLTFPPRTSEQFITFGLLDAILIFDKVDNDADQYFSIESNIEEKPWLLICDMYQLNELNVGQLSYADRISWAFHEVVQPWTASFENGSLSNQLATVGIMDCFGIVESKYFGRTADPWRFCGDALGFESEEEGCGDDQGQAEIQDFLMTGKVKYVRLETDFSKKEILHAKVKQLCRSRGDGFPGRTPVPLRLTNIKWLSQEHYVVGKGEQGMRCLVYIMDQDKVYAFDKDNEVFYIEGLDFPHRQENRSIRNTLLDAEMIIDKNIEHGGEILTPRLLIYDIIQFEDLNIGSRPYIDRRMCIDHEIIRPRKRAQATGTLRQQQIDVQIKVVYDVSLIRNLLSPSFAEHAEHQREQLTFIPLKGGYFCGRSIEWRSPTQETVHFMMKLEVDNLSSENECYGYLYLSRIGQPVERLSLRASTKLFNFHKRIVECVYDIRTTDWIFVKESDRAVASGNEEYQEVAHRTLYSVSPWQLLKFVSGL